MCNIHQLCEMNSLCICGAMELRPDFCPPKSAWQSRGHTGKARRARPGGLQLHSSGWWIQKSNRERASSPEVWKPPESNETSTTSCLLPSRESEWKGQPAGIHSMAVIRLGSVRGQICSSTSSMSTHSVGGSSAGGKTAGLRGLWRGLHNSVWCHRWELEKQIKMILSNPEWFLNWDNFISHVWRKRL